MWAINMSRLDLRGAERTVNTVLLCSIGILMGLLMATVVIYAGLDRDESSGFRTMVQRGTPNPP